MADYNESDRFAGTSGPLMVKKTKPQPLGPRPIAAQSFWATIDNLQTGWHTLGWIIGDNPDAPIWIMKKSWILGNSIELDGNGDPMIGAAVPILHSLAPIGINELHYRIEIIWPNGDPNLPLSILTKIWVWNMPGDTP